MDDDVVFPGFRKPTGQFYRVPNEFNDDIAEIDNLAELKVVLYIMRHTWGFKEGYGKFVKLTIDELMNGRKRTDGSRMDKGTGLSKQSVVTGVQRAVKHGYIIEIKDDKDKGREKKFYSIKMKKEEEEDTCQESRQGDKDTCQESRQVESKTLTPGSYSVDTSGTETRQRTDKETQEKKLQKDIEERNGESPSRKSGMVAIDARNACKAFSTPNDLPECTEKLNTIYFQSGVKLADYREKVQTLTTRISNLSIEIVNESGYNSRVELLVACLCKAYNLEEL
jgi:hypothetical protein